MLFRRSAAIVLFASTSFGCSASGDGGAAGGVGGDGSGNGGTSSGTGGIPISGAGGTGGTAVIDPNQPPPDGNEDCDSVLEVTYRDFTEAHPDFEMPFRGDVV